MMNNFYKGKFIVFEGIDGAGRSTQVAGLGEFLVHNNFNVVTTKEPTEDSEAGRKIKKTLKEKTEIDPMEFQKLYVQDREEHLKNRIIPALKDGKIVISDRYFFSTFAYGFSHGADLEKLIKLNNNFLYPDMVFLFKISAKEAIKRIEKRGDPKELFEKEQMLKKVNLAYQNLAKRFKNFYIIDAEKSKKEVEEQIKKVVISKLFEKEV